MLTVETFIVLFDVFILKMQIDSELSRTVVVSTKLDTKIPQFARSSDVEVFLRPPACTLDGCLLGDSPFFTSVPSGRVGSGHESVYRSNDEFKQVISCIIFSNIIFYIDYILDNKWL